MFQQPAIAVHDPSSFTATYMQPHQALHQLLQHDFSKFFIVLVEEMYRLVQRPVPASRATTHTCIFLTEGEAEMKIGSEIYRIGKEELLFVPAGQVFSFRHGHDRNRGYLCVFDNDMILPRRGDTDDFEFLKVWGEPRLKPDAAAARRILPLFDRLLQDYSQHGLQHRDIIRTYLTALLSEADLVYQPALSQHSATARYITRQFRELLLAHIHNKHRVSDYADLLHITPNHLNKTVKAVTGQSPTRWIDEAIIQEAKVLLCQCNFSVQEIAAALGLEDPSYFTRLFRKYEGCTPTDFRRMIDKSWNMPHPS